MKPIKLHESWNEIWPERNSSETYLEGNLCRRDGAYQFQKKLIQEFKKDHHINGIAPLFDESTLFRIIEIIKALQA